MRLGATHFFLDSNRKKSMSYLIEKLYEEHQALVEEVYRLRADNKELEERCAELQEFFNETTKPNPEFYRSMIELVRMIPQE